MNYFSASPAWINNPVYGMEQLEVPPWPSGWILDLALQVPPSQPWVDPWGWCLLPTQSKTGLSSFLWAGITAVILGTLRGMSVSPPGTWKGLGAFCSLPPRATWVKLFWLRRRRRRKMTV